LAYFRSEGFTEPLAGLAPGLYRIEGEHHECFADIAGPRIPVFIDFAGCAAGKSSLKVTWERKLYRNLCPRGQLRPVRKLRNL
jgi:hypothetical protein